MIRKDDERPGLHAPQQAKFKAVVEEIVKTPRHRPARAGGHRVRGKERDALRHARAARACRHVVLNAKHHQKEAEIVAQAGKVGAVTIATNMAGRGTDILLGGNPEFLARRELMRQGMYAEELIEEAIGY